MDKYVVAPPLGSTNNSVGAADGKWQEGYFEKLPNWQEYLAESTGYGIVSGCEPTINNLTVTVGAGIVHLTGGTRKEITQTNITLDDADSTNPRIDLVYITSAGEVAKITGTASATPTVPMLPTGGISVCNVSVAAGATTGTLTNMRGMLPRYYNTGIVNVKDYGAVGDGVTDDTAAFGNAIRQGKRVYIPSGSYKITDYVICDNDVVCEGEFTEKKPLFSTPRRLKDITQIGGVKDFITGYKGVAYGEAMTYNSKTGKILLALYKYTSGSQGTIILTLNKDTYAIENSIEIPGVYAVNGLAYDKLEDVVYMCADTIYKADANDLTSYEVVVLPNQGGRVCFDAITDTAAIIRRDSESGIEVTIYNAALTKQLKQVQFYDIDLGDAFQDCAYYDGKVYVITWQYVWELDVCKGTAFGIGIDGGVEIEGIADVDNDLFFYAHSDGDSVGYESLYRLYESTTVQTFNNLEENKVKIAPDVDLNAFIAYGEYIVSTNDTSNKNYPPNENKGFLTVLSNARMDVENTIYYQEFKSLLSPYNRYIRYNFRNNGGWTSWKRQLAVISNTVITVSTAGFVANKPDWQSVHLPDDVGDCVLIVSADKGSGGSSSAIRVNYNETPANILLIPSNATDSRTVALSTMKPKGVPVYLNLLNLSGVSVKLFMLENSL